MTAPHGEREGFSVFVERCNRQGGGYPPTWVLVAVWAIAIGAVAGLLWALFA